MSYRDNHRGHGSSGRRDGRRSELRLLEDEPRTDRYDRPALWSRGHGDEPPRGRSSRARDRAYARDDRAYDRDRDRGYEREDWRDNYRALRARSRWPIMFTAVGVVVLFFGGLMLVSPPGGSGAIGVPCSAASCDQVTGSTSGSARPRPTASAPAVAPSPPASSGSAPSSAPASPSGSAKATVSAPAAALSTSPAPSASPALRSVRVRYSLVSSGAGVFQGKFVIVNRGRTPIKDWQLTFVLSGGAQVSTAFPASFKQSGDTVTLIPPAYALTIPAHSRVTERFTASGTITRPVSCMFSGASC